MSEQDRMGKFAWKARAEAAESRVAELQMMLNVRTIEVNNEEKTNDQLLRMNAELQEQVRVLRDELESVASCIAAAPMSSNDKKRLERLRQLIARAAFVEHIGLTEKRLRIAKVALHRIGDDEEGLGCECDHDDENCCEKVDEYCPTCIAAVALQAIDAAMAESQK